MKYDARKHWTLDVEIVAADADLCCEQVIYCARALGEACYRHGGLEAEIGDDFYHRLHIWATRDADIAAIVKICSVMCAYGCVVFPVGNDYLRNFDYRLATANKL